MSPVGALPFGQAAYAAAGDGTILNPVPGAPLIDSYGAPRSGGRRHAGIDIMAPEGTPVVAPVDGTVVVEGDGGGLGGIRVWLRGKVDNLAYYFAHLSSESVTVGDQLVAGQQLGTVGTTGNARGGPPHLHFSINAAVGNENPVANPYDVIDRDGAAGGGVTPQVDRGSSDTSTPTSETASGLSIGIPNPFDVDNWVEIGVNIAFIGAGLALVVVGVIKTADPQGSVTAKLKGGAMKAATGGLA